MVSTVKYRQKDQFYFNGRFPESWVLKYCTCIFSGAERYISMIYFWLWSNLSKCAHFDKGFFFRNSNTFYQNYKYKYFTNQTCRVKICFLLQKEKTFQFSFCVFWNPSSSKYGQDYDKLRIYSWTSCSSQSHEGSSENVLLT